MAADYLESRKGEITKGTLDMYRLHVENHLNKYFGGMKVNRIRFPELDEYKRFKVKEGKNSRSGIKKIFGTLTRVMTYAAQSGYCQLQPFPKFPKEQPNAEKVDKKTHFTPDEINTFLKAAEAKSKKMWMFFYLAIATGMRFSELVGLEWDYVDFNKSQIHVRWTYTRKDGRKHPKTNAGLRSIGIGPDCVSRLREWKLACPSSDQGLVFPSDAGTYLNYSNVRERVYKPLLKKAKLQYIRFHDLRHTYASILVKSVRGAKSLPDQLKYLQSQMGHENISTTMNVYAHVLEDQDQDTAKAFEQVMLGKDKDVSDDDRSGVVRKIRRRS